MARFARNTAASCSRRIRSAERTPPALARPGRGRSPRRRRWRSPAWRLAAQAIAVPGSGRCSSTQARAQTPAIDIGLRACSALMWIGLAATAMPDDTPITIATSVASTAETGDESGEDPEASVDPRHGGIAECDGCPRHHEEAGVDRVVVVRGVPRGARHRDARAPGRQILGESEQRNPCQAGEGKDPAVR